MATPGKHVEDGTEVKTGTTERHIPCLPRGKTLVLRGRPPQRLRARICEARVGTNARLPPLTPIRTLDVFKVDAVSLANRPDSQPNASVSRMEAEVCEGTSTKIPPLPSLLPPGDPIEQPSPASAAPRLEGLEPQSRPRSGDCQ